MNQSITEDLSPNPYDLNRLANAVEQLKTKCIIFFYNIWFFFLVGGFKDRPSTQQFSQEKADLALENNLNFFTGKFVENTQKSLIKPKIVSNDTNDKPIKNNTNNNVKLENMSNTKNVTINLFNDQNNDDEDIVVITTRTLVLILIKTN